VDVFPPLPFVCGVKSDKFVVIEKIEEGLPELSGCDGSFGFEERFRKIDTVFPFLNKAPLAQQLPYC
jgi:hypothetical protein